jgi:uncharacterized UBP type Zn finger protein
MTENPFTKDLDEAKIHNSVPFEEYLNLGQFTASETPILYQLQGVIGHSGDRISSGHYIAAVRKPDGSSFCSINDDNAISQDKGGDVHELYNIRSRNTDFIPYVLFLSFQRIVEKRNAKV